MNLEFSYVLEKKKQRSNQHFLLFSLDQTFECYAVVSTKSNDVIKFNDFYYVGMEHKLSQNETVQKLPPIDTYLLVWFGEMDLDNNDFPIPIFKGRARILLNNLRVRTNHSSNNVELVLWDEEGIRVFIQPTRNDITFRNVMIKSAEDDIAEYEQMHIDEMYDFGMSFQNYTWQNYDIRKRGLTEMVWYYNKNGFNRFNNLSFLLYRTSESDEKFWKHLYNECKWIRKIWKHDYKKDPEIQLWCDMVVTFVARLYSYVSDRMGDLAEEPHVTRGGDCEDVVVAILQFFDAFINAELTNHNLKKLQEAAKCYIPFYVITAAFDGQFSVDSASKKPTSIPNGVNEAINARRDPSIKRTGHVTSLFIPVGWFAEHVEDGPVKTWLYQKYGHEAIQHTKALPVLFGEGTNLVEPSGKAAPSGYKDCFQIAHRLFTDKRSKFFSFIKKGTNASDFYDCFVNVYTAFFLRESHGKLPNFGFYCSNKKANPDGTFVTGITLPEIMTKDDNVLFRLHPVMSEHLIQTSIHQAKTRPPTPTFIRDEQHTKFQWYKYTTGSTPVLDIPKTWLNGQLELLKNYHKGHDLKKQDRKSAKQACFFVPVTTLLSPVFWQNMQELKNDQRCIYLCTKCIKFGYNLADIRVTFCVV